MEIKLKFRFLPILLVFGLILFVMGSANATDVSISSVNGTIQNVIDNIV
ncbi:hypothetical protein [Methanobrevibacter filiformis]|uniref:Uncharacterized protein n=1 Tax=Methanobrevibacter filiformis TaxID=55758 RepID=A0A166C105_9EURY|nr:hypothetical protein [Methanobrevibacter filiformis]KZX14019.1 hypothetical protein MBFIL_09430 [Methanobrevibacter filiformis]